MKVEELFRGLPRDIDFKLKKLKTTFNSDY